MTTISKDSLIKDDMLFKPYCYAGEAPDGYQCKIKLSAGIISVRYKGYGLIVDSSRPYEVWYPTEDAPSGYQTANDIFNYIKRHGK